MEMTEKKYKLVIFDVDGTILDTSEGLLASTVYMIEKLDYPMPDPDVLRSFVGPRIQDSVERIFGLQGSQLKEAVDIFRDRYKGKDVLRACPYDGIFNVLSALKEQGIHITVATNKRQDFTDELMKKYNFSSYVEGVYGTDAAGKLRKIDLLKKCLDQFPEYDSKSAVMVGDSSYDAEAASALGIDFVGVTYGFDFKEEKDLANWPYTGIAANPNELIDILLR